MSSLTDFANRIRATKIEVILDAILEELMPKILDLNRQQMIDGETSKGEMLRPKYTEDPYFKSRGQALAYAGWKAKMENEGKIPKSNKKHYTAPNLFITGYYHSLIKGAVMDEYIDIGSDGFGSNFGQKYKDLYGLQEPNLQIIRDKVLPVLQDRIRESLGIKK